MKVTSYVSILFLNLLFLAGCKDTPPSLEDSPPKFRFEISSHKNGDTVGIETLTGFNGVCNDSQFKDNIMVYPIVFAPGPAYYPYTDVSYNGDGKWETEMSIGSKKFDKPGTRFVVYFCAVYTADTVLIEKALESAPFGSKSLGRRIPDYCTSLCEVEIFGK